MRQDATIITVRTRGRGLHESPAAAVAFVRDGGFTTGLLTLWCRHTSASLLVTENASPEVLEDLADWVADLAPEDPARYRHGIEGPDDMPAHLRAALTGVHLAIPVIDGVLALGTWQGVFLFEQRARPHRREVAMHLIG